MQSSLSLVELVCLLFLRVHIAMSHFESPFAEFALIDLSYGGRTLQMRPSQLTTANIARAFRLIPDTIILVSERDTVALPQDGVFHDVDDCYTWIVEGEKATTNMSMAGGPGTAVAKGKGAERWKPQAFPPILSSSSRSSGGAAKVLTLLLGRC